MDLLDRLNPAQREAVTCTSGPLLVLAGAGTGKTRVITVRIAHLLEGGIAPQEILAVTFTNKAAREMRERVCSLVGSRPRGLALSTFHSLGMRILRSEAEALGLRPNFTIHDTADQISQVRSLLRDVAGDVPIRDPKLVLSAISRAKNRFEFPEDLLDSAADRVEYTIARLYARYQEQLRSLNGVDFDDLILLPVVLFNSNEDARERYRERWRHILVDEYQDTNAAQYRFLRSLVGPERNLCVVGDDDQSIYGFRGVDAEKILRFESDYPGARVVKLEENYRCAPEILELANAVIAGNALRHEKTLRSNLPSTGPVISVTAADEHDEVNYVVSEIEALVLKHRISPADIAVLMRSAIQARPFEEKLRLRRIPYVLVGGQSYFDRKEVRDVLAYWRVAANTRDDVAFLRILNVPRRGLGPTATRRLDELARGTGISLVDAASRAAGGEGDFLPAARRALGELQLLVRTAAEAIRDGACARGARELLEAVSYEKSLEELYPDPLTRQARWNVVLDMLAMVESWESRRPQGGFSAFLNALALESDSPAEEDDSRTQRGVRLMTLHSAKGLEFRHVFLVGVEEGLLPHRKSLAEGDRGLEEERRLLYVGITRARQRLTLTRAAARAARGRMEPRKPSRFLAELADGSYLREDDLAARPTAEEKRGYLEAFLRRRDPDAAPPSLS